MSFNFPPPKFIQNWFNQTNQDVKKYGLHQAMFRLSHRLGTDIAVNFQDQKTITTLAKSPCLVVANHPHDAEPLILFAALPPRNDSYLVANVDLMGLIPAVDRHLITVYIAHHFKREKRTWHPLVQFINRCYPRTEMTDHEAHQKNIKAINLSVTKINQGHLTIIFPENRQGNWQTGTGHLVSNLEKNNHPQMVMAYIKGTTRFDLLRTIPWFRGLFPQISVTFSPAINLKPFAKTDPKKIAKTLEIKYKNWAQGL